MRSGRFGELAHPPKSRSLAVLGMTGVDGGFEAAPTYIPALTSGARQATRSGRFEKLVEATEKQIPRRARDDRR
jgi:hypothetical protein